MFPQLAWGDEEHSLLGSAPWMMFSQTPSTPAPFQAAEHALQIPRQADSQHTPSTQKPDRHAEDELHAAPFERSGPHTPWSQTLPVEH